ncbi:MAG: adenine-specific methyltransferase EcoRI family protein [Bacillota bacterium]
MAGNNNLKQANRAKKDEFYTQLVDIEKEMKHYKEHFRDKVVFCNCDDTYESNFFKYFALNFNFLGLKKLIATCYATSPVMYSQSSLFSGEDTILSVAKEDRKPYKIEITEVKDQNGDDSINLFDVEYLLKNDKNVLTMLDSDGDFRSEESIELLKEADIIVTNPPFSLFREYVLQLCEYNKNFIILGNQNAITYKEIFKLIKENKLWLGMDNGGTKWFQVPFDYEIKTASRTKIENGVKYFSMGSIMWYTNLDTPKRQQELILYKKYDRMCNLNYQNYHAINVDKYADIPYDYDGYMGVPITFLDKYNPNQFEIIALGIVGSIEFTSKRKMEILKDGVPTGKYTINAKGTLYRKYNHEIDRKPPAFRDCDTNELYSSIYARIIIKQKEVK